MTKATFVIELDDGLAERVCDLHLPESVRSIIPRFAEEAKVAPLNDTAGFDCDWCATPSPIQGFGGQDITYETQEQ
jgi:hypothetical protein